MPNPKENQVNSKAPCFKEKFKAKLKSLKPSAALSKAVMAKLKSLKPSAALSKAVIVFSVNGYLLLGLGYLAVATNYTGTIDIQMPNLTMRIHNLNK